jgi:hypothetical protein
MKKTTKSLKTEKVAFDFRSIKSFELACEKLNIPPVLPEVSMLPERFRKALVAVYKLFIIFEAINDGWVAELGNGRQAKYWPWLWVLSSGSGFSDSGSTYCYVYPGTGVGSRLCTFSPEAAKFIGKQFGVEGQEYKDFFLNAE